MIGDIVEPQDSLTRALKEKGASLVGFAAFSWEGSELATNLSVAVSLAVES